MELTNGTEVRGWNVAQCLTPKPDIMWESPEARCPITQLNQIGYFLGAKRSAFDSLEGEPVF